VAVTWSRYGPGQDGASHHVHREHSDAFYLLDGEMAFLLGDEEHVLGAGTFVVVPPGVVHGFRNTDAGEVRFLNVHAPSGGFHEALRARRRGEETADDFDTYDPPPDGGRPASEAVVRGPGAGEELRMGDSTALIKAGVGDAGGRVALLESTLGPGFPGPVAHRHRKMFDTFWVLEGTLRMRLGDEEVDVAPGSYAVAPPGTVHTFSNPGSEPVRLLNVMIPGGLEQYLREVHAAVRPGRPPDPQLMASIAARYDFLPAS
jgi:mannose-6-phosphate isomerase-like protein (cupin superfamily)